MSFYSSAGKFSARRIGSIPGFWHHSGFLPPMALVFWGVSLCCITEVVIPHSLYGFRSVARWSPMALSFCQLSHTQNPCWQLEGRGMPLAMGADLAFAILETWESGLGPYFTTRC